MTPSFLLRHAILPVVLSLAAGTAWPAGTPAAAPATAPAVGAPADGSTYVPAVPPLPDQTTSELRDLVERIIADRAALNRRYSADFSDVRRMRMREFHRAWRARLDRIDFASLGQDGRVDYILLRNRLDYELQLLDREDRRATETAALLPFRPAITTLHEARRNLETIDPAATAATLDRLAKDIDRTRAAVEAGLKPDAGPENIDAIKTTKIVAFRAADIIGDLRRTLEQWSKYYDGYDPLFTWWARAPYKQVDKALGDYLKVLREKVVGVKEGEDDPIVGDPIGRESILQDLAFEMIPYTPEDLVAIAHTEFAWCEAEMKKAARQMGLGDDWKSALERVKTRYVEPGRQTGLVRDLAFEAIEFVEKRDLVTVPPLARDMWRMEMLSPEQQKVSPFFLGGEVIQVAFPTETMAHEDKLMTLRGNNRHFARAVVHHELIPGHHLQGFIAERFNTHRRAFTTPFSVEGWALYWEMLLWDLDFPQSPEDRIGMLFWRMHRAARIIFSLSFHLGTMTPQEAIDFLVERVGHERANATGEVRRSFNGSYPPLYQVAYMIGGLQFRALHRELVGSRQMSDREFHDAALELNRIPVELVRASLTKQPLTRDYSARWRFAGEKPGGNAP